MTVDIILDDASLRTARAFADKSVSSSIDQYARRRQTDPRQIQHQIEIGKIAEFGVHAWLAETGQIVTMPDVTVYDARHKSYAPDLTFTTGFNGDVPVHVKAQDKQSADRFGLSWTFQYGASVGSDREIFAPDPKGYVAFVLVHNGNAVIYGATKVATLHEHNLFRDPKLARLRGIKTVVYYEDLARLPEPQLWALTDEFGTLEHYQKLEAQ